MAKFALLAHGCLADEEEAELLSGDLFVFSHRPGGFGLADYMVAVHSYKQMAWEDAFKIAVRRPALRFAGQKRSPAAEEPAAVQDKAVTLDLAWLFSVLAEKPERSSSEQILSAIAGLNRLLKNRQFSELNLILGIVSPERLSPELMLTFARLTFPVRDLLSDWFSFVTNVKNELDRRKLDAKQLLKGLI
jgi:hypothetical protein